MTSIKVYRVGDNDYVAAKCHEEALSFYCELTDELPSEYLDDVVELDDSMLNRLRYYHEEPVWNEVTKEYDMGPSSTFREALQEKINDGEEFPLHFASTEW